MAELTSSRSPRATTTSSWSAAAREGCRRRIAWRGRGRACAVISRDEAPGGMFRRFPVFQRLISWTKPTRRSSAARASTSATTTTACSATSRVHRALAPRFMDRAFDLPARTRWRPRWSSSPSAAASASATSANGCRRAATAQFGSRRRTATIAAGRACSLSARPIRGSRDPGPRGCAALRGHAGRPPATKARASSSSATQLGLRGGQGLLPWARKIVLASPRPVDTTVLAFSPLRLRYLQPFDEYVRGGSGGYVVDAAIERIERHADGFRDPRERHVVATASSPRADDIVAATGSASRSATCPTSASRRSATAGCLRRRRTGKASPSRGIYFAGNATSASAGMRKHGATANSTSVNGFRYNARLLAQRDRRAHFALPQSDRSPSATARPVPGATSSHSPRSSGSSRRYLTRVVASTRARPARRGLRAAHLLRRPRRPRRGRRRRRARPGRLDRACSLPPAGRERHRAPAGAASAPRFYETDDNREELEHALSASSSP